ncbi:flavin reductase family protein [uncultured Caulobacter sp.]|uniref:flavin reductase family protein n=1 Tax=uncultured Caulobacter sp. TaxID=158749 RepID=UPI002626AE2D|nr:flavin reductase family protein [uncultured Caulobacter sp.]
MSAAIQALAPAPSDFRKAMGSFPAGVTVVTACHDGRLVGTTVSAFSSVSMDPPLVMVCLKRDSRTLAALSLARAFCVNILARDQADLAYRFARSGADDRFTHFSRQGEAAVEAGACGAPLLAGCVTAIECDLHAAHDGGDHEILVGRVLRVVTDDTKTPLVYVRGGFLNA